MLTGFVFPSSPYKNFFLVILMFKALIFSLALLPVFLFGQENYEVEITPVAKELRMRMPEWRPKVLEQYPNGTPKLVIFYTDNEMGEEEAVKRIHLFESGRPFEETDLTTVSEDSPGFKEWKGAIVPHGASVRLRENGEVEKIAFFDRGLLHGPMKVFHSKDQVQHITTFNQGKPEGKLYSYHKNGKLAAEGEYEEGKLVGDYTSYYESGNREVLIPYVDGEIHGKMIEWYEGGSERAEYQYVRGKLYSEGSQMAVVRYDENHAIVEVQDFREGVPCGDHIKYHPNERQSYHVRYVDGKKDGKECWFNTEGKLFGEGQHIKGRKVGKHWRKHENGTMAYLAVYSRKGQQKGPIREFDENGQKVAEYSQNEEGKLEGPYKSWFPDGALQNDCHYASGQFEGEQKQYYPSGQIKLFGHYKNKVRDGLFEQWYEDGNPALRAVFKEGNKDGEFVEWYSNGQMRLKKHFVNSLFHGEQREWHEDGVLRLEARYDQGKKDGTFRSWAENGVLIFEGTFDQDRPMGAHIAYYDSGDKMEVFHFLDGKKEGKHEQYYPDGQLKVVETFKGDLLEGEAMGYYEDGSQMFIRHFSKGAPTGKQTEFFPPNEEKGTGIANLYFYNENGKLEGQQKTFYPSGATKTVISYSDGVLHGLKGLWDEEGNLLEESRFEKGKLEGRHLEKDQEGREIVYHYVNNKREGPHYVYYPLELTEGEKSVAIEATYKDNQLSGIVTEYDPSGAKISTTTYKNGLKDGEAELFHRSGKLAIRLTFKKDLREGLSQQYFQNGQVHKVINFANDMKEGEEKTFFNDGRLNSIYSYKEDKLHGAAKHWNESGILIFEAEYKDGVQHGKFVKYYDDGKLRLEQYFIEGKLDGVKKNYDPSGKVTEVRYEKGTKVS
ncbi:hypothetical protein NEPTK9_001070 [Candidatus Neptunochlamydia vexilliferae]|uniref:Phophatidylinositol-4-phosphate 5-kinase n=2 Tax=Candidatus Neptunichlamydia vexilliferae TaxID=1651774 RepID=A0ABS0B1J8_9BACT|nr:hypothetical protein [Candidatus Neptunochlamydia vexilliferae]